MKNTPTRELASRSASKSPSWIAERDALLLFGDRKTRAIIAIYHALRSAKKAEFFVHPDIAKRWSLSPADLNWALDRLEGKLVETVGSTKGRYRMMRLVTQFEETASSSGSHPEKSSPSPVTLGEERVEIDTAAVMARLAAGREAQEAHTQPEC
jgi:hypothetical protein